MSALKNTLVVLTVLFVGCKQDSLKSNPMSANNDLQHFVYKVEAKYKREASANNIDLHFQTTGTDEIRIILTYKKPGEQDLALSIAEAASNLTKRLLLEEANLRSQNIKVSTETKLRSP